MNFAAVGKKKKKKKSNQNPVPPEHSVFLTSPQTKLKTILLF